MPASRGGSGGEAAGRSRARAGGVCGLRRLWERCVRKGERPRAAPPDAGGRLHLPTLLLLLVQLPVVLVARVVPHALASHRVVAVALGFGAERADHLRVAVVTPLSDIDVAAKLFERGVGTDALHFLDRRVEIKERCDFDDTTDADRHQDADREQPRFLLEELVVKSAPEAGAF